MAVEVTARATRSPVATEAQSFPFGHTPSDRACATSAVTPTDASAMRRSTPGDAPAPPPCPFPG